MCNYIFNNIFWPSYLIHHLSIGGCYLTLNYSPGGAVWSWPSIGSDVISTFYQSNHSVEWFQRKILTKLCLDYANMTLVNITAGNFFCTSLCVCNCFSIVSSTNYTSGHFEVFLSFHGLHIWQKTLVTLQGRRSFRLDIKLVTQRKVPCGFRRITRWCHSSNKTM